MVSTASVVIIALLALLVGAITGALLWRSYGPQTSGKQDLEKRLEDAERRLGDYQNEVTEHFVETSRRVNALTRNYKDVHEYLASSAVKLTTPSLGREMRAAAQISWSEDQTAAGAQAEGEDDAPDEEPRQASSREDGAPGNR